MAGDGQDDTPIILERVLWFPSMLPGTLSDLMKDERKRMNALGGRGMWPTSRFFAWEGLVAEMRGASSSDISSKRGACPEAMSTSRDSGLYGIGVNSESKE